jgi:hypothetical protein
MRLFEINQQLLTEGGNIWKGDLATDRIPKDLVIPTIKFLEKITGLELQSNMLGSTGLKETSGDLDLAVDPKYTDKDQLATKLQAWANKHDPSALVKKVGINVHFRCPIAGKPGMGYVQTDFMMINDISFAKWSMRHDPNSKYPGKVKTILIASMAKAMNLSYGMATGLSYRHTKKPFPKGTNPDVIAKVLINKNATAKDINSPEAILNALKKDPNAAEKLKDAKETLAKENIDL